MSSRKKRQTNGERQVQKKIHKSRSFPKRTVFVLSGICLVASLLGFVIYEKMQNVSLPDFIARASRHHYNVLLITIDTLRADHLGCYGFREISTPSIDQLAASGTLFLNMTAHAPMTLPSHTSIHTGHFPSFHGVHDNGGFYVPKSELTLAEIFKQHGFATAAFVGAFVLDSSWGLDQGFDTYFDNFDLSKEDRINMGNIQRPAGDVYDHAIHWLDQHKQQRFFLWTHFYDPHSPYTPPKEYEQLYPHRPYIGEIAYTDSVVGKLFSYLDRNGLRDNTVILLTGDHGESLGDHGESTHTFFVYDSTLHVPLILSTPLKQTRGRTIVNQSRSIDIYPTLLQLAGLDVPENTQGRSLLHLILDSTKLDSPPSYAEAYYPQFHFGWCRLLSLRTTNFKYIDAPKPELYDLKADPKEQNNIYSQHKDRALKMKRELDKIVEQKAGEATMKPGAMDDETHEKLAALGYVGAFQAPTTQNPLTLGDPKDKIGLFNMMTDARLDSVEEKTDLAIEKYKHILELDPHIVDAYFCLGNEYLRKEKYQDAADSFKKALELKPDYDFAMLNLATAYRKMGKIDEALVGFLHFLEENPQNMQVLYHIGETYLFKNEPDNALEYLQRALKVDPDTAWVYNSMGVAYVQKKDAAKAKEYFEKSLAMKSDINMTNFNLAELYEKEGKTLEAEQHYLAELKIGPKNFKAHFNLGRLYMNTGRFTEGIEHLKSTVQLAPDFALGYLFLAQAYVEDGAELDQAVEMAKKGLSLKPEKQYKPLGYLVLADIYNRQGRKDLEQRELAKAGKD
jgi:arylsulfatase A-like enzyme/Tfp pilus assembly protein PilF